MKKSYLLLCALFLLPVSALAEEKNTVITTTIPSTYSLTIPANQAVTVNMEKTALPDLKVSGDLAPNQQVRVSARIEAMKNKDNPQAPALPFSLTDTAGNSWSTESWSVEEAVEQKAAKVYLNIEKAAWTQAKPGRYEGKIVFTSAIE